MIIMIVVHDLISHRLVHAVGFKLMSYIDSL